nr:3'-5' exonuclease [Campylobacter sp.]
MSQKESLCVFDCETIPDTELIEKFASSDMLKASKNGKKIDLKKLSELFMKEHEEKTGSGFLPVNFHKIVCISCVMCDEFGKFIRVTTIPAENEKEMINKFLSYIDKFNPRLVSFNGRGFDLPMIMIRAMKYNLSATNYFCTNDKLNGKDKWNNYRSRYDGAFHLDLLDHISDFGSVRGFKLDTLCASLNLPGKYDVSGDQVLELYYQNENDKISEYCQSDVLNTYWLFLKYELLRGNLIKEDYLNNLDLMKNWLNQNKPQASYTPVFEQYIQKELGEI